MGRLVVGYINAEIRTRSGTTDDSFAGCMTMSWEIDIWARPSFERGARAMLLATDDARRGVWLTLVSDLAQAYFQLLALEVVG